MKYKILVNQNTCIGCGACTQVCDNFELIDGKSHVKNKEVDELGCNAEAEKACPVNAISIKELS
jgi:ferredoxin